MTFPVAHLSVRGFGGGPRDQRRERLGSAAGVALLHALVAYLILTAPGPEQVSRPSHRLIAFELAPEPPRPEPSVPAAIRSKAPEGAAAPAGLKARPAPVLALPRQLPVKSNPVSAAPNPGTGDDRSAGASAQPGPGPGSGGEGRGTGSGASGDGSGGGGIATRARLIRGTIRDSDYPRAAGRARIGGTVVARLNVDAGGRVGRCAVTRSSGNAELDSTTCRLIEERFRYEPARDSRGRAVASVVGWRQVWWLEPRRGSERER